jgi:hypothetical protein
MFTVNEKTDFGFRLTFYDFDGVEVTPSSITYRIDDVKSGNTIKGDTVVVPAGSPYDLEIDDADNTMVDATRNFEIRRITLTYLYSTGKTGRDEIIYKVNNLKKIT